MIAKAAIPPGGEGEIEVTLDTKGKTGKLDKSIKVTSNDPKNRMRTIRVMAFVELDFEFESANLFLGKLDTEETVTKSAYIQVLDPAEIEIGAITTSSPLLAARVLGYLPSEDGPSRLEIELTAGPGFPNGQFQATVKVHSNLARKPVTEMRVWADIPSGVQINPQALNFTVRGSARSGGNPTKLIRITNYDKGLPLEILDYRDLDDHLKLDLTIKKAGQVMELTATPKKDKIPEEGYCSGRIQITTNNPQYEKLIVSYRIVWQK